jgi:hypothetical protein
MMVFMSKRMIACDEASFLISYRQDARLGFIRWWKLKMHLLTCHLCCKYAHQIKQLKHSMEQYRHYCGNGTCPHHLSEEASMKIQHSIDKEISAN